MLLVAWKIKVSAPLTSDRERHRETPDPPEVPGAEAVSVPRLVAALAGVEGQEVPALEQTSCDS